ncbi:uncharacterized protein LOC128223626 [Mya arenaria]|uniref:uncharacterized protein LOC128223626 n=1 Tax=Mya arenaria TaxID=6604 RepID=UPI0022E93EE3|nr:uncharacterized protein LOC128223626 [Mya arenaria]
MINTPECDPDRNLPCGSGNYPDDFFCERCPRGTYQDEIGQLDCKPCPDGWTTAGMQTRNISLCNVPLDKPTHSERPVLYSFIITGLVVSVFLVFIGVWCNRKLVKSNVYCGRRPKKVSAYPRRHGHPREIGNIKYAWGEMHHGQSNADENDFVEKSI